MIGFPESDGDVVYNSLLVTQQGDIATKYRKQCLPNYQVFDERRYFVAGDTPCTIDLKNTKIAFTICEDLWEVEPARQAKDAGAQMLININASPFHTTKLKERQALVCKRSLEEGFPVVYVNLLGGQDELVFDGGSMAASEGQLSCQIPQFVELFRCGSDRLLGACRIIKQEILSSLSLEAQVCKRSFWDCEIMLRRIDFLAWFWGFLVGLARL